MKIEVTERVVRDFWYTDPKTGERFDALDLIETLGEVEGADVYVTDDRVGAFLLREKILDSLGSNRWMSPASPGPNFESFKRRLTESVARVRAGKDVSGPAS